MRFRDLMDLAMDNANGSKKPGASSFNAYFNIDDIVVDTIEIIKEIIKEDKIDIDDIFAQDEIDEAATQEEDE